MQKLNIYTKKYYQIAELRYFMPIDFKIALVLKRIFL